MHVWRGWRPALCIFSSYGRDAWLTVLLGDHTHTTSVSRLISPPSPIPVVSLPVMFFFPILITLATICLLHPLWYYLCLSLSRFPSNHMHLHSAWSLSDSPFISQPRFPPCSLSSSLPPFSPPLWLRVRLKLIVHLLSIFALVPLPLILCRCLFLGWATLLCLAWECWVVCAVRLQGQRIDTAHLWAEDKNSRLLISTTWKSNNTAPRFCFFVFYMTGLPLHVSLILVGSCYTWEKSQDLNQCN